MSNGKIVQLNCRHAGFVPGLLAQVEDLVRRGLKGGEVVITLGRPKRSDAQNRLMWALLKDISEQVVWHGKTLSSEDWKNIISVEVEGLRIVPGISVPFIAIGVSTRNKSKQWFSDFFEAAWAFGAEQGVNWSGKTRNEWAIFNGDPPPDPSAQHLGRVA